MVRPMRFERTTFGFGVGLIALFFYTIHPIQNTPKSSI